MDFPNHPNVGGSAIWLGECVWLASRRDCPVVFVADQETFDIHELRRATLVGTILLSGGGNFGDLWPACQTLRERYLRELPEYRIVQLPQSIWFGDTRAAATAADSARSHPDFMLLVRSDERYDVAKREFGLRNVQLTPNAAFLLDGLRARPASQDIVMLARTDHERHQAAQLDGVTAEDWMMYCGPISHWRLDEVTRWCIGRGKWRGRSAAPRWAAFLAHQRGRRGLK